MRKKPKVKEARKSLFEVGIGPVVLMLMALPFYIMMKGMSKWPDWLPAMIRNIKLDFLLAYSPKLLGLLLFGLIGVPAALWARRQKRSRQPQRNAALSESGPFALFLRPFVTDKRIMFFNPFVSDWIADFSADPAVIYPPEFVARVLEPYIPVRQMGAAHDGIAGATILSQDQEWQDSLIREVESALVVIILPTYWPSTDGKPSVGESTIWELSHLVASGAIHKTIAISPGVPLGRRSYARQGWENACAACLKFNLHLPLHSGEGNAFTFVQEGANWKVGRVFSYGKLSRKSMAANLVDAVLSLALEHGVNLSNPSRTTSQKSIS